MSRITVVGLALAISAAGCGDVTDPQSRFIFEALSPITFEGIVGSVAPHEPTVVVTDRAGHPVPNVTVAFTFYANGDDVAPIKKSEALTNEQGIARAGEWILSNTAGPNLLQAVVVGARQLWFTARGLPDTPVALVWQEANVAQIGFAGMAVQPPRAHVMDRFGNGVPGVLVTFEMTAGGGALEGAAWLTTDYGASAIAWTLGPTLGANTITARALELPSIDFTIEVVAASAIYDLTMINDEPLEYWSVESAFIGFTNDGRFVSQGYWNVDGQRELWTESGSYAVSHTQLGPTVVLERAGHRDTGTLVGADLLLDRWDGEGPTQHWRYSKRN